MPADSHRINLLPRAIKVKQEGRKLRFMLMAGAGVFVALLMFLWYQKGQQIKSVEGQTVAQKAKNAQIKAQIQKLQYLEVKAKALADREALVKDSWRGEISWYRFLHDLAETMPSQTWLTAFQAQSGGAPGGAAAAAGPSKAAGAARKPAAAAQPPEPLLVSGAFTVQGIGFAHPDSADWLTRISQMNEVVGLWLSQSTLVGTTETQQTVTFSSNGSLTQKAWSDRAKKAASGNIYEGTNAQ